jgi:hypothetical protein
MPTNADLRMPTATPARQRNTKKVRFSAMAIGSALDLACGNNKQQTTQKWTT